MFTHWTEQSIKDYHFRIAADFIAQLQDKMESKNISQDMLAEMIGVTKSRISQVINNPGNMTIGLMVKFARALGLKVSLIAYDDDDPSNIKGPINSEIFKICWEKTGKPRDFWDMEETQEPKVIYGQISNTYASTDIGSMGYYWQTLPSWPLGIESKISETNDMKIINFL
jgi:transcriptional regulator with XRE-family HTH domain